MPPLTFVSLFAGIGGIQPTLASNEPGTPASGKSSSTRSPRKYLRSIGLRFLASATCATFTGTSSDRSTSSPAGTPANPSQSPAVGAESTTRGTSGPKSTASFATYDPASCSWRTCQGTFPWGSDEYSGTWPRAGTTRNGTAYQRQPLAPRISATACSSWPTPTTRDRGTDAPNREGGPSLAVAVRNWPTPTSRDWKDGSSIGAAPVNGLLGRAVNPTPATGSLNPTWVEWLMGFPTGWSDLGPSVTPSSRKSRSSSGSD